MTYVHFAYPTSKMECLLVTFVCFRRNFSRLAEKITRKQRDRSEMIRGSTNINWVCEKRVSGRIDAVYDKHSIVEVG